MSDGHMNVIKAVETVLKVSYHKFQILGTVPKFTMMIDILKGYCLLFLQTLIHQSEIIMPRVTPTGQSTLWLVPKEYRRKDDFTDRVVTSGVVFQNCI